MVVKKFRIELKQIKLLNFTLFLLINIIPWTNLIAFIYNWFKFLCRLFLKLFIHGKHSGTIKKIRVNKLLLLHIIIIYNGERCAIYWSPCTRCRGIQGHFYRKAQIRFILYPHSIRRRIAFQRCASISRDTSTSLLRFSRFASDRIIPDVPNVVCVLRHRSCEQ